MHNSAIRIHATPATEGQKSITGTHTASWIPLVLENQKIVWVEYVARRNFANTQLEIQSFWPQLNFSLSYSEALHVHKSWTENLCIFSLSSLNQLELDSIRLGSTWDGLFGGGLNSQRPQRYCENTHHETTRGRMKPRKRKREREGLQYLSYRVHKSNLESG